MRIRLFTYILLSTVLAANCCLAQIPAHIANQVSGEAFNPKDFTIAKTPAAQRTGVYHFGESEGEWDLLLIPCGNEFVVQVWYGEWANSYYTK